MLFRRGSKPSALSLVLAGLIVGAGQDASPARAQGLPTAAENLTPGDIDSEHLFGFTEGSDLGVPGEVRWSGRPRAVSADAWGGSRPSIRGSR